MVTEVEEAVVQQQVTFRNPAVEAEVPGPEVGLGIVLIRRRHAGEGEVAAQTEVTAQFITYTYMRFCLCLAERKIFLLQVASIIAEAGAPFLVPALRLH